MNTMMRNSPKLCKISFSPKNLIIFEAGLTYFDEAVSISKSSFDPKYGARSCVNLANLETSEKVNE